MSLLNSTPYVQQSLCSDVCSMRLLFGVKVPYVNLFPVNSYSCTPAIKAWPHSAKIGRSVEIYLGSVLHVYLLRNIPEILNAVICFNAVDVVNAIARLYTVNPQPSHSVGVLFSSANFKYYVPDSLGFSELFSARISVYRVKSCKDACRGIVLNMTLEFGNCKGRICNSHAVVPYKQWFGQKPRCASNTTRLRHFSVGRRSCKCIAGNTTQKIKSPGAT